MARGRKRKDSIIEKAVDTINKVINSGEQDKLGNTIYDTPSNIDKEVEEAFSIVKNEVHESDGSIQEFYYCCKGRNLPPKVLKNTLALLNQLIKYYDKFLS